MSNIDNHNQIVGRIIVYLVDNDPIGVTLTSQHIMVDTHLLDGNFDKKFSDIVLWMERENLIYIKSKYPLISGICLFGEIGLTAKGLNIVQGVVGGLDGTISKITADKSEMTSSAYGKIGSLVGGILGGFTQAIS